MAPATGTAVRAWGVAELVWYASYGSNMCAERFGCYLAGGTPTGSTRDHEGCRDATSATEDRAVVLPGTVFFSGTSRAWTGGHAYLDPTDRDSAAGPALGRAWLVTADQFDDVVAQENSHPVGSLALDAASMAPGETRLVSGSRYPVAWCLDTMDDVPVVTFTCAETIDQRVLNPPSLPYLRTLAIGLVEAGHHTDLTQAIRHLVTLPGVAGHWSSAALADALNG